MPNAKMPHCWKSHVVAHMYFETKTSMVDSFCCDALGVKTLFLARFNYLRTSNVVPNGALLACDLDLHCMSSYTHSLDYAR